MMWLQAVTQAAQNAQVAQVAIDVAKAASDAASKSPDTIATMTSFIHTMIGLIGLAGTGVSTYVALMLKAEVANTNTELAKIRTEMAQAETKQVMSRSADRDETRTWINGSFMRAKEVDAKLDGIQSQIDDLRESKKAA